MEPDDPFMKLVKPFFIEAQKNLDEAKKSLADTKKKFVDLLTFFAYNKMEASRLEPPEFFSIISKFIEKLQAEVKKIEDESKKKQKYY